MAAPQKHFEKQDRANELLRYGISVMGKDSPIVATAKGKVEIVLVLKRELARIGAWWQIKILEHHLHRFQKERKHWRKKP